MIKNFFFLSRCQCRKLRFNIYLSRESSSIERKKERNQSNEIEILNTVDQTRCSFTVRDGKAPIREQRNDCGETGVQKYER